MLALLPVMAIAAATMTDTNVMRMQVHDAHIEPTAAGASASVSMLMTNPTSATLVLVGASTPLAGETVLQHYVKDAQGLVQVAPLTRLVLKPNSETVVAPGALELQLIGLTSELKSGLELPLTLTFEDGTKRTIRLNVEEN